MRPDKSRPRKLSHLPPDELAALKSGGQGASDPLGRDPAEREAELLGQELRLDGRVLADVDGALPELRGREATDAIAVPGRAWAFVTTSEPACR